MTDQQRKPDVPDRATTPRPGETQRDADERVRRESGQGQGRQDKSGDQSRADR